MGYAVSILMSTYNSDSTIEAAIDSILKQTFTDFEFWIIDDGSCDKTPEILRKYQKSDARIRIHTQANSGLTKALNVGLKLASAPLIARQDADDISLPERLEKQCEFMNNHPKIALLGTACIDMYENGLKTIWHAPDEQILQKCVYYKTPFAHSTALMRTDIAKALGGYDETLRTAQDTEFWIRFAKAGPIAMLKEPLVERHIKTTSISHKKRTQQMLDALRARMKHRGAPVPLIAYHSLRTFITSILPPKIIGFAKRWRNK